MPLYGPSTATATVAANTNVVTITGMDLNAVVQQGMTINFGARDRAIGDAWIINTVSPNGTNGGTLTTAGNIPTAYSSEPFLIDTRGFNGTDSSFAAAVSLKLLATLTNLLGTATNLFAGSRQLVLDKVASTAIGRVAFAIAGRTWGDLAQRSLTYTPTGGQTATIETMALRAFPDGTTPSDALLLDLSNGTGDLRKGAATMVAGSTVDLGSAPMGKVTIAGAATINSFGAGRHLERLVRFGDGGSTLVHNATSLVLPGGANITVRPGDCLHATSDAAGNWRVHVYQRADGTPLILPISTLRAGFRNRIINGNFAINQRGVSSASTTYAAGTYILDRWKAGSGGVTLSWSAAANGDVTVNITAGSLLQIIEAAPYLPDSGTYVLSWVGTARASISTGPFVASPAFLTDRPDGSVAFIEFGTGTVTRVQFEPGTVVTPFEYRDDELRRCQRYFFRYEPNSEFFFNIAAQVNSQLLGLTVDFPVAMRVVPMVQFTATNNGTFNSGSPALEAATRYRARLRGDGNSYSLLTSFSASAEL